MPLNGSLTIVDATGKIQAAVEDVTVPDGFNGGTPLTAARQLTVTTATANLSKLAGLSYDTPGRLAESSAGPITAYVAGIPIDQQGRMVVANAAAVRYAPNAIPITATGAVALAGGVPPDSTAPTDPTGLLATPNSETQATLTWTASTDAVGVTLYRIERCTGAACVNFAEIATDNASPYVDATLAAATAYRYRIRAQDAALNLSGYSNIASVSTPDNTAPTAPSNLVATPVNETQVDLTWTGSTDNVGVTAYLLERCTGAGCSSFAEIAQPTATNYSDTGRSANTVYRYQVRARDAANNRSGYSAIATATTPDNTAPTAPTSLVATANSETQITLTWTAATDNVAVTQYRIERCTGVGCSSFTEVATDTASPYVDTGRTVNTTYRYQIRAQDAANNLGPYSNIATALTPDQTAPTAPTSLIANPDSASQITLTWAAATDNVAVAGYNLERCAGAGCSSFVEIATPAASPYSDPGLAAGTTYRYQIRARDAVPNFGLYSSIAEAVTTAPPAGAITPADLFLAGELGGWWDPSDMSTLFQDTAGATPVTTVGQPVGRINDKSGRGNHLTQATAGSRPLLQNANFENYLDFDGVDDFLVSPTINFATAVVNSMSIWLGVNKTTDTPTGSAVELSVTSASSNGVFMWQIPGTSPNGYFFRSRGTADPQLNINGFLQPRLDVLFSMSTITTDAIIARINGVQVANSSGDQGAGPYGNYPMYVGRRGGTSQPFKGRIYQLIVRGAITTAQHIIDIERYVAGRTGVAITATPLDLFLGGEVGAWWDPSDITTLFQDSAGTVPVTASGQPVGRISDKSGRGNHLTQPTAGARPTYIDTAGLKSLQFDGVDDWMISPTVNFAPGGGVMNMFAGLFADTNTGVGLVCELSATSSGNNGTFALQAPPGDLDGFYWRSKGTVDTTLDVDGISLPTTKVIHGQSGIPSDYSQIRVNGTQALQTLADQGTGTHGNFPIYVGMRGGTTFPFKGKIYGLILRASPCTTKEQADTEQYLAGKAGISFVSNP